MKKKRPPKPPTKAIQRSLAKLRREGWTATVVEKRIPPGVLKDAFGFGDILAFRTIPPHTDDRAPDGVHQIALVQTTNVSEWRRHLEKINGPITREQFESDEEFAAAQKVIRDALGWREAGGLILLHGWHFGSKYRFEEKRWMCRDAYLL